MKTLIISLLFVSYAFKGTVPADKPIATYRVGVAKVTVWENKGNDGGTWKNFQIDKLYKNGDQWETSNHFNELELLQLRAAIDAAINEQSVIKN